VRRRNRMSRRDALTRLLQGPFSGPLRNGIMDRPAKNDEMQGARILRNEAYNQYAARTKKDEAQHGGSCFSTAC